MSLQVLDIVHAANLSGFLKDKIQLSTSVTSLEVCGDFLFIGFKEGTILRCHTQSKNLDAPILTQVTHSCHLSQSQPVITMKSVSALNYLLVLSDETLSILDLETLEFLKQLKFKNVSSFCLNEDPINGDPFSVELAIGIKKKIHLVYINNDSVKNIKEFALGSGLPLAIAMDGMYICVSSGLEYFMLNTLTSEVQQLFCRDSVEQIPIIKRILKGEFLLSGPGGLGVFVSTDGISERPPIGFSSHVSSLAFHHPYIICQTAEGIQIYSSIDQQCKQTIAIPNIRSLIDGDGQIYVATSIDLFALRPISWQAQVTRLISENRIQEALHVATNARISTGDREQHRQMVADLQHQVAIQHFHAGNFSQAVELFDACNIDCRKVLKIDLQSLPDPETISRGQQFMVNYLKRRRDGGLLPDEKKAVDTTLLKFYAEDASSSSSLLQLIEDCQADENEATSIFQSSGHFHVLAAYRAIHGRLEEAFQTWERLIRGEDNDPQFPGCAFVAEQLVKYANWPLIWRFSVEILKKDASLASRIFIQAYQSQPMDSEAICDFLRPYPQTLGLFLQFLVHEKKVEDPAVHTRLALHYIAEISSSVSEKTSPVHRSTVNRLRSLLRSSPHLDLVRLSSVLKAPHFPHENAIVLGRLGNHSAAINIFIEQLKDFDAAEEYCACIDDATAWNSLLSVCVDLESQGAMMDRLIDLLRRRPQQFNAAHTLQHLPDDIKMDAVAPYIKFAVREVAHEKRMKMIQHSLSKMDHLQNKYIMAKIQKEAFLLNSTSYCCVCRKNFTLTDGIARYPNGVVTHTQCARNNQICPITGHVFSVNKFDQSL